jgi:hypothetical protein
MSILSSSPEPPALGSDRLQGGPQKPGEFARHGHRGWTLAQMLLRRTSVSCPSRGATASHPPTT